MRGYDWKLNTGLLVIVFFSCFLAGGLTVLATNEDNSEKGIVLSANFSETLPPRPVLTISAGVLPNSKLYFLDKMDEWLQRNLFTFGVSSFRAQSSLEQAAERIAELQVMNNQGALTREISNRLLKNYVRNMEKAAQTAGRDFLEDRRPVALTAKVISTAEAGIAALEEAYLFADWENWAPFTTGEDYIYENEKPAKKDGFASLEDHIDALLFPKDADVPSDIWRLVARQKLARVQRNLEKADKELPGLDSKEEIRIGGEQLRRAARGSLEYALLLYKNGHYRMAISFAKEARDARNALVSPALVLKNEELNNGKIASRKAEQILNELNMRGLLTLEEIKNAEKMIRQQLTPGS